MTHLFGHKWASVYGEAMAGRNLTPSAKHWLHDLSALSAADIGRGLESVVALRPEWPPNPMEFATICEAARPKDWKLTSHGIEAKGKELGIKPEDFEQWPSFKVAVMKAAEQKAIS